MGLTSAATTLGCPRPATSAVQTIGPQPAAPASKFQSATALAVVSEPVPSVVCDGRLDRLRACSKRVAKTFEPQGRNIKNRNRMSNTHGAHSGGLPGSTEAARGSAKAPARSSGTASTVLSVLCSVVVASSTNWRCPGTTNDRMLGAGPLESHSPSCCGEGGCCCCCTSSLSALGRFARGGVGGLWLAANSRNCVFLPARLGPFPRTLPS